MTNYSELVKRLRDNAPKYIAYHDAADAIEALQAEVERLKGAKGPARSNGAYWWDEACYSLGCHDYCYIGKTKEFKAIIDKLGESLPRPPQKTAGQRLQEWHAAARGAFVIDYEVAAAELGIEPEDIP